MTERAGAVIAGLIFLQTAAFFYLIWVGERLVRLVGELGTAATRELGRELKRQMIDDGDDGDATPDGYYQDAAGNIYRLDDGEPVKPEPVPKPEPLLRDALCTCGHQILVHKPSTFKLGFVQSPCTVPDCTCPTWTNSAGAR